MATQNLGRVAYADKGAYNSSTTYIEKDVVQYNNGSYVLKEKIATGIVPTNTNYWFPMQNPTAMNQATDLAITSAVDAQAAADSAVKAAGTANDTVNKSASPIHKSVTGVNYLEIGDAANKPLAGLKLYGRTDQAKSTGKNLLNGRNFPTKTIGGITFTTQEDGRVHISGTSTAIVNTYFTIESWPVGTFAISLDTGINGTAYFRKYYADGTQANYFAGSSFTVDGTESSFAVYLQINQNVTTDIVVGVQIEEGTTATAYEPYTGGVPGPNPDYPLKLKSPGDGGNITVKATGKNLIKQYTGGDNVGLKAEVQGDGYTRIYGTSTDSYYGDDGFRVTLYGGQTYTFSVEGNLPNTGNFGVYMWPDVQGTEADVVLHGAGSTTLYVPKTDTYRCMPTVQPNTTLDVRFRCTLTYGTEATEYEPYKDGGSVTASTPNGLPGLPVSNGGNYTDTDGQQWLCDEIDFERGVYVQRVGVKVFDDVDELQGAYMLMVPNYLESRTIQQFNIYAGNTDAGDVLCSILPTNRNVTNGMTEGVYSINGNLLVFGIKKSVLYEYGAENTAASLRTGMLAYITAMINAGTPITTVYRLATVLETPLSTSELASYRAMSTFNPHTVVYSDSDVRMTVDYTGETEKFVHEVVDDRTAPPIIETVSGSIISVNDSAHRPFAGLRLYGKTTQAKTTGKNLLNASKCEFNNAVTEKFAELVRIRDSITFSPGVKYVISFDTTNTGIACYVHEELVGTATHFTMDGKRKSFVFSYTDGKTVSNPRCITRYSETSSVSAGTISNIMIEVGSTATAYEPYTGGIPAPNPNYPQPLVNVGADGSIVAHARGQSLKASGMIDGISAVSGGITFTALNDGWVSMKGVSTSGWPQVLYPPYLQPAKILPAGEYRVTTFKRGAKTDNVQWIANANSINLNTVFTLTEPAAVLVFPVLNTQNVDVEVDCQIAYMITPADVIPTEYEPYKDVGSVTASTPNGLPGIPVTSGGNYTDNTGQQWICDEVDYGRGVYVQNLYTFKAFEKSFTQTGFTLYEAMCPYALHTYDIGALATHVPQSSYVYNNEFNVAHYWVHNDRCRVWLPEGASTEGLTVLGVLASPIEKPLSADEMYDYKAMTSQKPTTTVYNDAGAGMAVDYIADTKAYIDKKLAAIAAALIEQ